MDFVDLDKVLDQFEEEEKAAEEILPGKETKPSGYEEYLVTHQDRPWESLSFGQPVDSNAKQHNLHSQTVAYDDPYESLDRSVGEGQNGLKQLGYYSKNSYVDHHSQNTDTLGQSLSFEQELAQAKLKEEKIERYLPKLHLSNGVDQVTGPDVNGSLDGGKGEDGERRGLIASQPASIQTDTLSPASERELLSYPLPKSDILVEGHDKEHQDTELPTDQHSTQCKIVDTDSDVNIIYASSNSIETSHVVADQAPEDTAEVAQTNTTLSNSDPSEDLRGGMENNAASQQEANTDSFTLKETNTVIDEPSDRLTSEQEVAERVLQEEVVAPAGEKAEDSSAAQVVGFETDESDMDKDEMDAYLRDLETSMHPDSDAMSIQATTTVAVPPVQNIGDSGDHRPEQDMVTAAVVHSSADGGTSDSFSSQMNDGSASCVSGESDVNNSEAVGAVNSEGSTDSTMEDLVTGHQADDGRTVVSKNSNDGRDRDMSASLHTKHPDVVTDVSGRSEELAMTHSQLECSMDTDEKKLPVSVADSNVNGEDRPADKPSLGLSETNKNEISSGINMNRPIDTTSLEFPVAGNKNELSSVVKGKLEIEGLLDEIMAARLAQKSSELTNLEPAPVQSAAEQVVSRDSELSEKNRTQGWGPEGSMVCSRVRESSSASPEMTSPPESGSPSPTLGVGARPKDPSQMKKNRPNSLLGLSKISLGSPFSPPQLNTGPVIEVMLPASHQQSAMTELSEAEREPRTQLHSMGVRHLGAPPPTVSAPAPDGNATVPIDGAPAPSDSETLEDEEEMEAPVMRRPDMRGDAGMVMGEGVEASSGAHRPQSWSPSTLSPPPAQKTKRPTSLNLPVRQDRMGSLSPDGDNGRSRKVGVMQESGLAANEAGSSEEESMAVGGTDSYAYDDMSSADQEQQEGAAAAAEIPVDAPPPSILHLNLGKIAPTWVPDADAPACMECAARFTFTKRRHHCRACGKIFCSTCCGHKSRLTYLENKEGRVCVSCFHILSSAECVSPAGVSCRSPNPNNPIEYCSTVPPTQQANARAPLPTVMVPTGVLKRHGSNRKSEPKQVMFSDGIRPGGDLTELDGSDQARIPPRRSGRAQKKVEKQQGDHSSAKTRRLRGSDGMRNPCLIPDEGLPPVVVHTDDKGEVVLSEHSDSAALMAQIRSEEASPVIFAINLNLFVQVKIINLDCCVNRVVWCFTTRGMVTAGQEELVVVLETLPDEDTVPKDIFCHFSTVYEEAGKGNTVSNMGHSIFNQPFLDSGSHGGFLYIRSTFQCTNKLLMPATPFLFAILLQKWETPWAKVFPIRLMLRLGAEHRYYPCPLVSIRNRKPVFYEIGHTIMNLLADFRNFQYMLQQIRGVSIHMEDKKTFINFPRNRYEDVMKVVSSSNEHVMALGASFSLEADSHLVCIQNEDGNYQTQAINIQNKPRQVTGASFVVFNGALKSSSGLRAKSSIVEDGLMVQIMPEMMAALKQSLKDMTDFTIGCGSVTIPQPEEVVTVRWVDDDKNVNVGVKSPVDGMSLEGVESVYVHNATDYVGERYAIRWTQVFFLQTESGTSRWEPVDLSRVAETLATAVCIALTPHLQKLNEAGLTKIGLRVTLQPDSVGYEVGSNGERLPDFYINDLDNALIPVIHGAISTNQDGPIILELVLHLIH